MITILYGNGINLLNEGALTWDNLLSRIDSKWNMQGGLQCVETPNTIQYDQLELTSQYPSNQLLDNLCDVIRGPWRNDVYNRLSKIQQVNYLTTNYDLSLESYFHRNQQKGKEVLYNLYSYYSSLDVNSLYSVGNIWHIHGDINRQQSIILGYDHYCKQINKIQKYIPWTRKEISKIVQQGDSIGQKWAGKSWVDLFFMSDVYIVGLGLGFAELDLWWILDLWARCKKAKVVSNSIEYLDAIQHGHSSCKPTFMQTLNDFGIGYQPFKGESYANAYEQCLEYIESKL